MYLARSSWRASENEKDIAFICWFSPQMPAAAEWDQATARSWDLHPGSREWQGPVCPSHTLAGRVLGGRRRHARPPPFSPRCTQAHIQLSSLLPGWSHSVLGQDPMGSWREMPPCQGSLPTLEKSPTSAGPTWPWEPLRSAQWNHACSMSWIGSGTAGTKLVCLRDALLQVAGGLLCHKASPLGNS